MPSMNEYIVKRTLYRPSSTSLSSASPVLCSKDAQAGQRMSSKTSRVSLAFLSPIRISVPFLPWVCAGLTSLASLAASQPVGSLAFITA